MWGTPKNHERRSVPFPGLLIAPLETRCAGRDPDEPVFVGADGGVLRAGNFRNRVFNAAVARCIEKDDAFPRLTPHDQDIPPHRSPSRPARTSSPCNGCSATPPPR